jgi:hypothetical protein
MRLGHRGTWCILTFAALLLAGCRGSAGPKGPETVPVRGKLRFTKGGDVKSLAGRQARIEFESVDQPGVRAVGSINEDGSFTVATVLKDGSGSIGAVPGKHRVRLGLDERDEKLVAPQFLSFEKSGITVQLPSEDELSVDVWK